MYKKTYSVENFLCFFYGLYFAFTILQQTQFSQMFFWDILYNIVQNVVLIGILFGMFVSSKISKKWLFIIAICTFCIVLILFNRELSRKIIFLFVFIISGIKMHSEKFLKIYLYVGVTICALTILLYFLGIYRYDSFIVTRGERLYLGFTYSTFSSNYFFHFCIMYLVMKKTNINAFETIILLTINQALYRLTITRAVYFEVILLLIVAWGYRFFRKLYHSKGFCILVTCIMPLMCLVALFLTVNYNPNSSIYIALNFTLSNRLSLGNFAVQQYGIPLFGSPITWSTGRLGIERTKSYFYVDSSYVQIALVYGVFVLLFIVLSFSIIGYRAHKERKIMLCIGIIFLAIHSATEPQLFELNYNPIVLLIGTSFVKSYSLPIGHSILDATPSKGLHRKSVKLANR